MNPIENNTLRVLPELTEMFDSWQNVVFFDEDPINQYKRKLLSHKLYENNFIVFTRIGDRHNYYEFLPHLQNEKRYYQEKGKLKNYLVVISAHEGDAELAQEFSDHITFIQMPSMYSWYTDKLGETPPPTPSPLSKHFLSFNNRATWYRQALFYAFYKFNLLPKSYFSYLGTSRAEYTQFNAELETRFTEWYNQNLDPVGLRNMIPYKLAGDTEVPADISGWNGDWSCCDSNLYDTSFCSVITESTDSGAFNFGELRNDNSTFFTEKTFKAIAMQHPFIVFGNQDNLKYLHDLGFETFSDVIDESYDSVRYSRDRFSIMMQEILRLGNFSLEECRSMRDHLRPKLEHNWYHFKNVLPQTYAQDIDRIRTQLNELWQAKTALF